MTHDIAADPRLDPRLKDLLSMVPQVPATDVDSREALVAEANSEAARQAVDSFRPFMDLCDTEEAAPSAGLRVSTEQFVSAPDGNTIKLRVTRPDNEETVACVYYIHGGGMSNLSCFDGMYRGWAKLIAANGVAVVMVDFRNSVVASSAPEVAPFPAGLNDCVSGLKWVAEHAGAPAHRPGAHHRRRRERRGKSDPGHRAETQPGRRTGPGQGPLRPLPLHRRAVAVSREPVVHREQRHPARPAQQPGRGQLRDRGVQRAQPAGLALVRHPRRRDRVPPDGDQRQRVRSPAR